MRWRRTCLVPAVLLSVATPQTAHPRDPAVVLARVSVDRPQDAASVAAAFDETHVYDPGYVHVVLWPGDAARLSSLGHDYEVLVPDLVHHDERLRAAAQDAGAAYLPGPDRSDYRVLSDYVTEMRELAEKNPALVSLLELPHLTHEGRTVYGVEIAANVGRDDGRPVLYVDGIHHAREWPSGEYPMIFAHYLVEEWRKNPRVTRLLERARVMVVPVVNVDGFDYSRSSALARQGTVDSSHGSVCGAVHCEAYWRKNRRSYTGQTVPVVQRNPDAYGVDPNRNYSYLWGGGGASDSTLPAGDQTYRGPAPQSEPETQNVQDLVLSRSTTVIVSNHTYSRLVLRAWGDRDVDTPDEAYLKRLGQQMADAMGGYRNIKGIELYATTGSLSDWGYGTLGIPSYTFEHGLQFHPPYTGCTADCVEKEWGGVIEAFMIAGEAAVDPRAHGVVTGRITDHGGRAIPARLTITKDVENPLSQGNPTGDRFHRTSLRVTIHVDGSFEWHMPPSTPPRLLEGEHQRYEMRVVPVGAGEARTRVLRFVLRRGQVLRLGAIEV